MTGKVELIDVIQGLLIRKANRCFPSPEKQGINSQMALCQVWEANKNKKEKNNEKRSNNDK